MDLIGGQKEKPNWTGIILSIITILFVISLVAIAVLLLTPEDDTVGSQLITVATLNDESYRPTDVQFQWFSDESFIYINSSKYIIEGKSWLLELQKPFINKEFLVTEKIEKFSISDDGSLMLIHQNIRSLHRYSKTFQCKLLTIATMHIEILFNSSTDVRMCQWIPQTNDIIANIANKGLFYLKRNQEPVKLETSNPFYSSGVPDLLYENEIFHSNEAIWFSGSDWLVYAVFNNENVSNHEFTSYEFDGVKQYSMPFPKIGGAIPKVALVVFNISSEQIVNVDQPIDFDGSYLLSVTTSPQHLICIWKNRAQTEINVVAYSPWDGSQVRVIHTEKDINGWVEFGFPPYVFNESIYYARLRQQSTDSFHHIFVENVANSQSQGYYITQGEFDVIKIIGFAGNTSELLYISGQKSIFSRHIFKVEVTGKINPSQILTDNVFGKDCNYFDADLSPNQRSIYIKCLGSSFPKSFVASSTNFSENYLIEADASKLQALQKLKMPKKSFFHFINNNNEVDIELTTPSVVDEAHQYPLLVWISDTESLQATYKWSLALKDMLAASLHIMVAHVNFRGIRGKGHNFGSAYSYSDFTPEKDISAAIMYLNDHYFVNMDYINVYGKGYGGFIAGKLVEKASPRISCAVLINPIVNLNFHNAHFSEKFAANSKKSIDELKWQFNNDAVVLNDELKDLLIVHGIAEEEFLFENSATLFKQLIDETILYNSQIYTSKYERLFEEDTSEHLQMQITQFLTNCISAA